MNQSIIMDFNQDFLQSKPELEDDSKQYKDKLQTIQTLVKKFQDSSKKSELDLKFLQEFSSSLQMQKSHKENQRKTKEITLANQLKYLEGQQDNQLKLKTLSDEIDGLRQDSSNLSISNQELSSVLNGFKLKLVEKRSFYNEILRSESDLNQEIESIRAERQEIIFSKNLITSKRQEAELRKIELSTSHLKPQDKAKPIQPAAAKAKTQTSTEFLLILLITLVSILFFLS